MLLRKRFSRDFYQQFFDQHLYARHLPHSSRPTAPSAIKSMKNCAIIQNAFFLFADPRHTHIFLGKTLAPYAERKSLTHHLFMLFICFVYVHAFCEAHKNLQLVEEERW